MDYHFLSHQALCNDLSRPTTPLLLDLHCKETWISSY